MESKITAIYIKKGEKSDREKISCGIFRKDHGLEGDFHSGNKERQVVLLSLSARRELEKDTREGFCFSRFYETVQVDGVSLEGLPEGTRFSAGDVVMEITELKKRCFPECKIIQGGSVCVLIEGVVIARVVKTGKMSVGDMVGF